MPDVPWYRLPLRMPLWFGLVLLAGWGVVLWRGVVVSVAPAQMQTAATDTRPPLSTFWKPATR